MRIRGQGVVGGHDRLGRAMTGHVEVEVLSALFREGAETESSVHVDQEHVPLDVEQGLHAAESRRLGDECARILRSEDILHSVVVRDGYGRWQGARNVELVLLW